jgi:endonuclease YncB( thermonuclease family)
VTGFSRSPGFRVTPLAVLTLLAVGCSTSEPTSTPTIATADVAKAATVSRVSDGDTLRTTAGNKIRLVQIDAPELHGDCYGRAALAALRTLAPPGTRIVLERDPFLDATDRYGRQLRYVFVGGTNVNVALVRQGFASPYFFRGERGHFARDLLDAVADARTAKRGYWAACPAARLDPNRGSITGPG